MVRNKERGIYTPSENLTIQIYIESSDVDPRTFDVNRKHCSRRVRNPREQVSVETPGKRWDFRWSELPTCTVKQPASTAAGVGTPDMGREF